MSETKTTEVKAKFEKKANKTPEMVVVEPVGDATLNGSKEPVEMFRGKADQLVKSGKYKIKN